MKLIDKLDNDIINFFGEDILVDIEIDYNNPINMVKQIADKYNIKIQEKYVISKLEYALLKPNTILIDLFDTDDDRLFNVIRDLVRLIVDRKHPFDLAPFTILTTADELKHMDATSKTVIAYDIAEKIIINIQE